MNQLSMFGDVPEKQTWLRSEIAFTLSYDQTKIIKDIIRLYNDGQAFAVDCTYSKGVFWRSLPEPSYKFDIAPQFDDVIEASADDLPLGNESVHSVMFDPPFVPSKSNVPGIVKSRFTSFRSVEEMWSFYERAIHEHWRILEKNGILVVKCQDTVSSGINLFSHSEVEKYAAAAGFILIDLFILGNRSPLMSPNMRKQRHARKSHSFMYVFRKPK